MSQRRGGGGPRNSSPVVRDDEETVPFQEQIKNGVEVEGHLMLDEGGNMNNKNGSGIAPSEELSKEPQPSDATARTLDERFEIERHSAKVRHWKENPFAVGLVEPTWADQLRAEGCSGGGRGSRRNAARRSGLPPSSWTREEVDPDTGGCLCCSAWVCSHLGAGRVGNLAVLRQSEEWVEEVTEDPETGESTVRRYSRPRLDCIVGPYWPMLLLVTYPLILGVSLWTLMTAIPGKHLLIQFIWGTATLSLILALAMTACCDPGVLYKHASPPPQDDGSWRWNDSAHSYRPRGAFFDNDTAVVVEGFDHTCPWTGTAIGSKNMNAFQSFVCLVFTCLILDIILLTGAL